VGLAAFLVAVVGLSTVSAIVSWWADDVMYDPDIMIAAFGDLPQDPEQAEKLGVWIAAETVEGLAVQQRLSEALPLGLSLFSAPFTEGIERAAAATSARLIQTELFADIWKDALPLAHSGLIGALEGSEDGVLLAEDGVVSVDISLAILATYEQMIGLLPDIADNEVISRITGLEPGDLEEAIDGWVVANLPEDLGSFVLLESESLAAVQGWKVRLGQLTWMSALAALLAAAAAIVISPRPIRALVAVGVTFAAAVVIGLMAVTGAERAVVNALADLPFDRAGFDPGALLTGWWLVIVTFIAAAIGIGIAGWTIRWRNAGAIEPALP
jgi:hypothetical protein